MTNDISAQLEAALAARTAPSSAASIIAIADEVLASAGKPSRRKSGASKPGGTASGGSKTGGMFAALGSKRGLLVAGGAALGTVLLGVGAVFGIPALLGDSEPEPSETPVASAAPSPTEPVQLDLPPDHFDDGIADGEYPQAADSRGDAYPDAYKMEGWVWDKVGDNWAMTLYNGKAGSVFYLASPEGALFDVAKLKKGTGRTPQIVSWHAKKKSARISWGDNSAGALIDLKDGSVDPLAFKVGGESADSISLLGVGSDGVELWAATGEYRDTYTYRTNYGAKRSFKRWVTRSNYYLWDSDDGWRRILADKEDVHPVYYNYAASPDGERVLLEVYSKDESLYASSRSGGYGKPRFVTVRLKNGDDSFVKPKYESNDGYCGSVGWASELEFALECSSPIVFDVRDGSTLPYDRMAPPTGGERGYALLTEFGFEIDGQADGIGVLGMSYDGPGSADISLTAPDQLPATAADIASVVEVEPGVFRVHFAGVGFYNLDTRNGSVHLQMPDYDGATGQQLADATAVFYKEATPRERTWVGYLGPNYGA